MQEWGGCTPLPAPLRRIDVQPSFSDPLSPLPATFTRHPASVASKRLTLQLNPLNATLTKNQGGTSSQPEVYPSWSVPRCLRNVGVGYVVYIPDGFAGRLGVETFPSPYYCPLSLHQGSRTIANAKALFFPCEPNGTLHPRECVLQRFPCSGAAGCALQHLRAGTVINLSSRASRGICFSAEQNEKRNSSESRLRMTRWSTQA